MRPHSDVRMVARFISRSLGTAEIIAAHQAGDMGCVLRQEHALLGCCIAATDDKDLFAPEEFPITRRTVGNAEAREDALRGVQGLDVAAHVESSDLSYLEFCAKSFGLLAHVLSQGRSTDGRNARIIDDAICDGDLATEVFRY